MKLSSKPKTNEYECTLSIIQDEIDLLETYRYNLKKFAFYEVRKNANFSKKFFKILDEVDRLTLELANLEWQKNNELLKM